MSKSNSRVRSFDALARRRQRRARNVKRDKNIRLVDTRILAEEMAETSATLSARVRV